MWWKGNKDVRRCPPHELNDTPVFVGNGYELFDCSKCGHTVRVEPIAPAVEEFLRGQT